MSEGAAERRRRRPRAALVAVLGCFAAAALVPSVAAAGPADGDCDIPALVNTTNNTFGCEGDLQDVTGVAQGGEAEALPPDVREPPPLRTRRCAGIGSTGPIKAENVGCATARALARRAGRTRTYKAFGFTCRGSGLVGLKINCFRGARTVDTGRANSDGGDDTLAAYVVFTRRERTRLAN